MIVMMPGQVVSSAYFDIGFDYKVVLKRCLSSAKLNKELSSNKQSILKLIKREGLT